MKNALLIVFLGAALPSFSNLATEFHCSHHHAAISANAENASEKVDILNYHLFFDFTQKENQLQGEAVVKFETIQELDQLELQLLQLKVKEITYHGNKVKFERDGEKLSIPFSTNIPRGTVDSVRVVYSGLPVIDGSDFGGFYFRNNFMFNMGVAFFDQPHVYGRSWFPCVDNFTDRATFQFRIKTKKSFRAYANGTRQWEREFDDQTKEVKWSLNQAIPTYLAAIYVGQYKDHERAYHSELQNKDIPLMLVARPTEMGLMKNSFRNIDKLMNHYESIFGPYVWEKIGYALVPFTSGAMEHATLIAYPMDDADGSMDHEDLMAHELSHHWWGNWVTCASAEEMWINEGMASYSECLFYEALYGKEAYMKEMRSNHYTVLQRAHIYDGNHYALNKVPADATYGIHSYKKGADVVHSLRSYMGDSLFFEGLKYIQKMYGGKNISSEEFNACMSKFHPIADRFFSDWIYRKGGSCFLVESFKTEEKDGQYINRIKLDQITRAGISNYEKVPLTITLLDSDFNRLDVVRKSQDEVEISSDFAPSYVGINLDERLSLATTAKKERISTGGNRDWNYANCELEIEGVESDAYLVVEQHWVQARGIEQVKKARLSPERFYTVDGIGLQQLKGSLDFRFSGQLSANGMLDVFLFQLTGGNSDQIVLYHRKESTDAWTLHPDYTVTQDGTNHGTVHVEGIEKGQYILGIKT